MIESQNLNPEMLNVTEDVTFTPLEWKYFVLELKDMIAAGNFNLQKVIHNARYWAEIERRTERMKAGHYVEHDLIEDDDDRLIYDIDEYGFLHIISCKGHYV